MNRHSRNSLLECTVVLSLLLWCNPLSAADLVPESTSPNGKYVLAFECPPSRDSDPPPSVWFVRLPELAHVSVQLTPTDEVIYRKKRIKGIETLVYRNERTGPNADNRQMMFETLVASANYKVEGIRPAANYRVSWSKDSRRVTIQAGGHKFAHVSIFRLRQDRFRLSKYLSSAAYQ